MTNIIAIMDKVCEFDTSKPAYALDAVDYKDLRADEHRNSYPTKEIVKNAKNVKNNSFVVPKVSLTVKRKDLINVGFKKTERNA